MEWKFSNWAKAWNLTNGILVTLSLATLTTEMKYTESTYENIRVGFCIYIHDLAVDLMHSFTLIYYEIKKNSLGET